MSDLILDQTDSDLDLEAYLNDLPMPEIPALEMDTLDQDDLDALFNSWIENDQLFIEDVDTTQPELDPDEVEKWLDGLEPTSFEMEL